MRRRVDRSSSRRPPEAGLSRGERAVATGSPRFQIRSAIEELAIGWRIVLGVLGAALVAAVAALLLGPASWWLAGSAVRRLAESPDKQLVAVDAARGRILQLLLVVGGLVTLWFTARTYALSREGHVTDRFAKAVDQLGAKTAKEQVGGIYALERIMRDSAKDHGPIVEALVAFLQEHARSSKALEEDDARARHTKPPRRPVAVQAALTVLGRRPTRPTAELGPLRLNETVLMRTFLRGADLQCARMRDARLQWAHMERAHLEGARLHKAHLEHARLREAYLDHADLEAAHLEEAHLQDAQMDGVNLVKASMAGAELDGASLKGAHLAGANLAVVKGKPKLSPKQKAEVCCLPETLDSTTDPDFLKHARAELPRKHPCARYWHWGRTLDEPAASDVPPVAGSDQAEQPSRREPEPITSPAPPPPSTPT
jgi:pentapeptide repeat protein